MNRTAEFNIRNYKASIPSFDCFHLSIHNSIIIIIIIIQAHLKTQLLKEDRPLSFTMATNYSITIINESSVDDRVYLLFQEKPVENPLDAPQVFYNIFAEAPPIASGDGSQVTFNLQKEFFAICGIPPAPLAKGVKISTSSFLPVTLAQGGASPSPGTSTFLTSIRGAPKWDNAATSTTDDALNGFAINTDTSFNYPNKSMWKNHTNTDS